MTKSQKIRFLVFFFLWFSDLPNLWCVPKKKQTTHKKKRRFGHYSPKISKEQHNPTLMTDFDRLRDNCDTPSFSVPTLTLLNGDGAPHQTYADALNYFYPVSDHEVIPQEESPILHATSSNQLDYFGEIVDQPDQVEEIEIESGGKFIFFIFATGDSRAVISFIFFFPHLDLPFIYLFFLYTHSGRNTTRRGNKAS